MWRSWSIKIIIHDDPAKCGDWEDPGSLALNVPVPYKYGTHQCVEPRFHALEPHLSRTSRALPTRVPRTRAAVRRRPRNSHSHASRGSAHFHAFAGRSSTHFHAIGNRSSAHFHAIISHALIPTHSRPMINVAPCIPTKLQIAVYNAAMVSCIF